MGALTGAKAVPVEEYLSNPAYEHFEYADGELLERNVGSGEHAKITAICAFRLVQYFRTNHMGQPGGYAVVEPHCRLRIGRRIHFRLPDVAAVLRDAEGERYLDRAPDLVVEIRSPEDRMTHLFAKMNEYFANGARLGWIVLPEESAVLVLAPGAPLKVVAGDEWLDGGGLLPELKFPAAELFR